MGIQQLNVYLQKDGIIKKLWSTHFTYTMIPIKNKTDECELDSHLEGFNA